MRKQLAIWGGCAALLFASTIYYGLKYSNVKKDGVFYIKPDVRTIDSVAVNLKKENRLRVYTTFYLTAKLKLRSDNKLKPGRYRIRKNMSNLDLLRMFRYGRQEAVKFTFNSMRNMEGLCRIIDKELALKSEDFLEVLSDSINRREKFGFNESEIMAMFIPNTYYIYWNISAGNFIARMHTEYRKFWTKERRTKAAKHGLTPIQVSVLASIIEEETADIKEYPVIAGVYLNRLRIGMKLNADPTLKFAAGDFSLKRLLNVHKEIDSPYNTYKYGGLPPGPIKIPSMQSIEGVLNADKHDYLYFCAKSDFSGTHVFSKTLNAHNIQARKYREALNKRNIYK